MKKFASIWTQGKPYSLVDFFFFFGCAFVICLSPNLKAHSKQWQSQESGSGGSRLKDKIKSKKLIWKILININNKVNNQLYASEILIDNLT